MDRARRFALTTPAGWIASGLGSGLSPFAPGTLGSLVALVPYVLLREWGLAAVLLASAVLFAAGVWAAGRAIAAVGREDPGVVTVDEWVGQWLTLALMEIGGGLLDLHAPSRVALLLVGFLVFRACDIAKPWPANWADRNVKGGLGAMLDDVFAGVWAGVLGTLALVVADRFR
jgi:phosphatidylglycerophosphatase A